MINEEVSYNNRIREKEERLNILNKRYNLISIIRLILGICFIGVILLWIQITFLIAFSLL